MIQVNEFYNSLKNNNINFFCGVPDSLLKDFCSYLFANVSKTNHIITANEGNAIALACGYYLATSIPGVVYMQNSGIGNAVNPLLSLVDINVYNIPILLIIGWRGEPGIKDEPQHLKQGLVTKKLLKTLDIDYCILDSETNNFRDLVKNAIIFMNQTKKPFAFLVRKNTFSPYKHELDSFQKLEMFREQAIQILANNISEEDAIVSTTGKISRELYSFREKTNNRHNQDFLNVGSMGHASSIALGIALQKQNKRIICFDGDGAALMHLGALSTIGSINPINFKHIVFNNGAHDTVGGQPTTAFITSLSNCAVSCGYKKVYTVKTQDELVKILPYFMSFNQGASFLEIKVKCGSRSDLERPKESPIYNKEIFMSFLNEK